MSVQKIPVLPENQLYFIYQFFDFSEDSFNGIFKLFRLRLAQGFVDLRGLLEKSFLLFFQLLNFRQ